MFQFYWQRLMQVVP